MKRTSLTLRVVVMAAFWLGIALAAVGYAVLQMFEASALRQFDKRLEAELVLLTVAVSRAPDAPQTRMTSPDFSRIYSGLYWQAEKTQADGGQTDLFGSRSLWDHRFRHRKAETGILRGALAGPDGQVVRALCQRVRGLDGVWWDLVVAADRAELNAELDEIRRGLMRSGLLLALLLLAAAALLMRSALAPLWRLRSAVQELSQSDGERLPESFPSEIAPLVSDLNALLTKNRRLRERGRVQAANLAHALKTPAAVLQNEIDRAGSGGQLDLELATQSIRRIAIAADSHLSNASASAQDMPDDETHDAVPLLADLLRAMRRLFPETEFTADTPPALPIRMAPNDQQEILGNLLENAAKWAEGKVAVALKVQGLTAVLTVSDDGPGIPEGKRDAILEQGVRLDESRSGTGLGLGIVAEILERVEGTIAFADAPLGGLQVVVTLPLMKA